MHRRYSPLIALTLTAALAGCGSYEKTLAAAGAVGCGVIGSSIHGHGTMGRVLRGTVGAGACALVAGAIGRMLDERDRARMETATQKVLAQPIPAAFYSQSRSGSSSTSSSRSRASTRRRQSAPPAPPQEPTQAAAAPPTPSPALPDKAAPAAEAPAPAQATPQSAAPAPEAAQVAQDAPKPPQEAPAASAPAPAEDAPPVPSQPGRFGNIPRAPKAEWVSDHSGARGSATIVAVEQATAEHGPCRTVALRASLPGEEPVTQTEKYCESENGANDWTKL